MQESTIYSTKNIMTLWILTERITAMNLLLGETSMSVLNASSKNDWSSSKIFKKNLTKILWILLIVIGITAFLSGSVSIPLRDLWHPENLSSSMKTILFQLRLPRIVMAIIVGMLLSAGGTVVQTVFQNPLADPYIIGISASATFGAVLAYLFHMPDYLYGGFAFVCCLGSTFLIFQISRMGNGMNMATLLIVGIAVSSFLGAFTSFSMVLIGEDSFRITMWMMGYLGNATWPKIGILLVPLLFSIVYFSLERHKLDALLSGDEEAHSLGIDVKRLKIRLLVVVALIVAFSVAFTGMIGFVGLMVPHIVKAILGASHSTSLPAIILSGGLFLLSCDTLGRCIFAPVEIPIGVVTGFLGAPFFLYLALKRNRTRS
jgi:iron complex transport system permease protein